MLIQNFGTISGAHTARGAAAVQRQSSTAVGEASAADQVTLSTTARALAAGEVGKMSVMTLTQEELLRAISNDTAANADKLAYEMAYTPSRVMFDISHGDTRLASTGQVVGDDYVANFEKLSATIDAQQRALYDAEKAKGTDPREIIAKIIGFRNAQSDEYRVATAWGYF